MGCVRVSELDRHSKEAYYYVKVGNYGAIIDSDSDSESSDIHLSATFATKFCDIISAERLAVDVGGTLIQVTEEFIRESYKIELGE